MAHPEGGRGEQFKISNDFYSIYEFVKQKTEYKFLSTTKENITVKPSTSKNGKVLTLAFIGENSRHGNVCPACWGYRFNCSGTRIGHCVEPLANLSTITKSPKSIQNSQSIANVTDLSQADIDRFVYSLAKSYLPSLGISGLTQEVFNRYLDPKILRPKPKTISTTEGLYRRLLESLQNANMKATVIGKSVGGIDRLDTVLFGFNPNEVLRAYDTNWDRLLQVIVEKLKPRGQIRRTSQSLWPKYCKGILSSAEFLQQFSSADDFYSWVNFFVKDERARASLPMIISREIQGYGFALACDFLKELGYVEFPKPDVHLRDIFSALNLCDCPKDDYHLFKAIVRVAHNASVTPYNADKTFWLIGSGNFYADSKIGRIPSQKKQFMQFAKSKLGD